MISNLAEISPVWPQYRRSDGVRSPVDGLCGHFAGLVDVAHPPASVERLMLFLRAYVDESHAGRPDGRVFVVAAYYAPAGVWAVLVERWAAALAEHGITAFHAADCEAGRNEFKGRSRESRRSLHEQFIGIINDPSLPIKAAGAAVLMEPYRKMAPLFRVYRAVEHGLSVSGSFDHVYHLAMQNLVEYVTSTEAVTALPDVERVAFICDRNDEVSGKAAFMVNAIAADKKLSYWPRIGSMVFDDSAKVLPLQAADMLAHAMYRHIDEHHLRRMPERWQYYQLKKRLLPGDLMIFDHGSLERYRRILEQEYPARREAAFWAAVRAWWRQFRA